MRKLTLLAAMMIIICSCAKDDSVSTENKTIKIEADIVASSSFAWASDAEIGVFCDDLKAANLPYVLGSGSGTNATFDGQMHADSRSHTIYAYYPYNYAVGKVAEQLHFNLDKVQYSADNLAKNNFMIATPTQTSTKESSVALEFAPVCAMFNFAISVPTNLTAVTIKRISATCAAQPFYTYVGADITQNEISFPARGAISSSQKIDLIISSPAATSAGAIFNTSMVILPDAYNAPITFTIETTTGNYGFKMTPNVTLSRGGSKAISYTLNALDWYDPALPKIDVEALPSPNPISTPISVAIGDVIATGVTPVKIVLRPANTGDQLTYIVTSADIAAGKAVIRECEGNTRPAPETVYIVEVLDGNNILLASATVTTQAALIDPDMEVITTAGDIKSILENANRKVKVFLSPGTYTNNTADVVITKDLILMADSPSNTVIVSSKNLAPKGTITDLIFSGFTWKATTGHFVRPIANDANGAFDFTNLVASNVVFDFSATTNGSTGVIYFPRARASENSIDRRGRVRNYTLDNIIYVGKGDVDLDDNFQCVMHTGGTDFWVQMETITIKNSTFCSTYFGLITLPSSTTESQLMLNGNVVPEIVLENNTFYRICCKSSFASASAVIHTGSGALSIKAILRLKNNVVVFAGPSAFFGLINCTLDTQEASKANYSNNWGLKSQPWLFRGALQGTANNPPWPGLGDSNFNGTANELFANPMNNPLSEGASLRIVGTAVASVGDPRWR